jgi:hypothetical protein
MLHHQPLYDFWSRSTGCWVSPLLTLNIHWLTESAIPAIAQIHGLDQVEFGIEMRWNYCKKIDADSMFWCVDSQHPNVVFTDKSISHNSPPSVFHYQLHNLDRLVMSVGHYEETIVLESFHQRLREQRYNGKLMRRLREIKVETTIADRFCLLPAAFCSMTKGQRSQIAAASSPTKFYPIKF